MKNKKGFTLMELLGILSLLALLVLVAFPAILNTINRSKNNISSATKQLIFSAADLYAKNNVNIIDTAPGAVNCIRIQSLIDDEYLVADLIDPETGNKIDQDKYVKMEFSDSYKYTNTIVTECTPVEGHLEAELTPDL